MKNRIVMLAAAVCLAGTVALARGSDPGKAGVKADSAAKVETAKAGSGKGETAGAERGWKLIVYYLHGTYRCGTCMSIEKQAKAAVEGDFKKEITSGKVVFKSLNYEEPENEHFGNDYQLMTRSLVLSVRKDGKELKWKNLPAIWTHVHNPPAFREYVSGEVKAMLKEMK